MNSNEQNQLQHENVSLEIPKDSFELSDHEPPDHKRSIYVAPSQTFGKVLLATLKPGAGGLGNPVKAAARRLRVDKAKTESTAVASWLDRQTRIWSSFSHDNILKFIGYHAEDDFTTIYIFSPYMNYGNAERYLKEKQPTMGKRLLLLTDTVMGIDYLHNLSPPVIHGNLRAANVLITDNGRAVLGDVGLYTSENCVELIEGSQYFLLLPWFSPESLSTPERTTKSDIWAWGCLAVELIRGSLPYSSWKEPYIESKILEGVLPDILQNWPDGLLELVKECWSFRPEDRPNARTCVESMNITLSLITEVIDCLGSSFIAEERIKAQANRKSLSSRSSNRSTRKAGLSPSGVLVVVKEINIRKIGSMSSRADFVKRVAGPTAPLSSLRHDNILELIGYSASYPFDTLWLVAPYMANGNILDYMRKQNQVDVNGKLELARHVMSGLQFLHSRQPPVVHGHLTPSSVLINETGKAILDDWYWGVIKRYQESTTSPRVSVRWSSPEVNRGDSAVVQSDIWSWACVAVQLVTGNPPYSSFVSEDHVKVVISVGEWGIVTPETFLKTEHIPDSLMRLLHRCWKFDSSQRPNAQECMDILDTLLRADLDACPTHSPDDDISRFITSVSPQAICINGRFGDVFKGTHKTMGDVALKRLRIAASALAEEVVRRFEREADTWRRLNHPHVLKFLGTYKPEAHLYFVSPFAANGTLLEYVSERPAVNRIRLLCETSDAVDYLHREDIVHGDIKASNLLISDDGHVLLCDFGLAKNTYAQTSTALKGAGTFRWQSPELWDNGPRSFSSDVYAFSMTIVEVLTGLPPFSDLDNEVAVLVAVYQTDSRPAKTPMESNGVSYKNAWEVAEACWPKIPGDRISMSEAFRLLKADPSLA